MTVASWSLVRNVTRQQYDDESGLVAAAFFLIIPWMLISMFAGLGPPPETLTEWTKSAKEQQIRYFMLVISGVSMAFGFVILHARLGRKGAHFYSLLSITALMIALPLFILNMLYWGFYLTELAALQAGSNGGGLPPWALPARQLFGMVSVVEVALTYLATLLLAQAMQQAGWLGKTSGALYFLFSLLGFTIIILSAFQTETFETAGFAVSIPAIPFVLPYYIGVNLLQKVGEHKLNGVL